MQRRTLEDIKQAFQEKLRQRVERERPAAPYVPPANADEVHAWVGSLAESDDWTDVYEKNREDRTVELTEQSIRDYELLLLSRIREGGPAATLARADLVHLYMRLQVQPWINHVMRYAAPENWEEVSPQPPPAELRQGELVPHSHGRVLYKSRLYPTLRAWVGRGDFSGLQGSPVYFEHAEGQELVMANLFYAVRMIYGAVLRSDSYHAAPAPIRYYSGGREEDAQKWHASTDHVVLRSPLDTHQASQTLTEYEKDKRATDRAVGP